MLERLDSIGNLDITVIRRESKHTTEWLGVETLELAGLASRLQTYHAVASTYVLILVSGEAPRALDFLRRQRAVASSGPPATQLT